MKKQFRKKNNYRPAISIIFLFLLIITFGFFFSKPFKITKEVIAVGGTNSVGILNISAASGGVQNFNQAGIGGDVTGGTAKLYVNGNVGIGTTAPGSKLQVDTAAASSLNTLVLNQSDTGYFAQDVATAGRGVRIRKTGSPTTTYAPLAIDSASGAEGDLFNVKWNGNVGIGTTAPAKQLEIVSAASNSELQLKAAGGTGVYQNLLFLGDTTSAQIWHGNSTYASWGGANSMNIYSSGGPITFHPGGTTNAMYLNTSGNVGIGTTAPGTKLDVQGTVTATGFNGPCIKLADPVFNLNGTKNCNRADIAEVYKASENVESGDVLITDANNPSMLKKSSSSYDPALVGVVTTSPAIILGSENNIVVIGGETNLYPSKIENRRKPAIALAGKVPVKISQSSESIKAGDYLTSSDIPGKAMKATRAGATVGKALEDWTPGSGKNSILVFLNVSWYDPDVYLTDTGNLVINGSMPETFAVQNSKDSSVITRIAAFAEVVVGKIRAGIIETKQLIVDGVDIAKKLTELSNKADTQQKQIDELKKAIEELKNK